MAAQAHARADRWCPQLEGIECHRGVPRSGPSGPQRLIPAGTLAALPVRFMDRLFDNYVMTPMQRIVADHIRPPAQRDAVTMREAGALLESAYE